MSSWSPEPAEFVRHEFEELAFTEHAEDALAERQLDLTWVERTVRQPDWIAADPKRPGVERRFRVVPEYGGRVLRVACYETENEIRIVTVFFDRNARKPR